ncbi:RagB/SusD family nutrient uptake outer membrane protein [Sphingobacterium tabacisoli]|uniref:RagB/SusD family nutrient uptake outer membrane protein n=1 Tax=Sphingobacterium tabacisoli TaxID=2044855 RepID=A0ABW5L1H8_9SPHI|nr:RagB/SusD family nutrient uptake outer membrane protein [Sphingobacterium tabacisoli]
MKRKRILLYSACLASILHLSSCESFLSIDPPKDRVAAEDAFSDNKTAEATVLGLYVGMNNYNNQFGSALLTLLLSSASDDYYSAFTSYDEYRFNNITPSASYLDRLWSHPYGYINHANKIIEGLEASSLNEDVKKQLSAEARFIRSFSFFYLTNLFNKVPLVTTSDINTANTLGPSTQEEVYQFVVEDLIRAESDISDEYLGTQQGASSERIRPNKKAVSALLSRVYLYKKDWKNAESTATTVINDTRYKIPSDLNTVFLKTSQEAIWQLQTVNTTTAGVNTWEGFTIVPATATARGYYNVYQPTLDSYEANDKRKDNWLKPYTIASGTFYMPYKYKVRTGSPVTEYNTVLRLAEQYLIRAEARLNQGKTVDAITDINVIRERAGLTLLPNTLSPEETALALEKERHLELLGEWGHRWFDLARTNRAVAVLSVTKGNFTQADTKIPIAESILLSNKKLEQND